MTTNTRASAAWPERDGTRSESPTRPTAEHPVATSRCSEVAHSSNREDAGDLGTTSEETPREPLAAAVRDALPVALLAQPAVGVLVYDARGTVTTMNERMEEITGQRHEAIHVEEWPRRYHLHGRGSDAPLEPAENPLTIALTGRDVADAPVALARPGRPRRLLRCSAVPLRGPDGAVLGGLALFVETDVAVPDPLPAAPADERLLVRTVEHEMRTPLTCVIGHLELLADLATELRGDARWSWEALVRGAARLQAAVDNLTGQPSRPGDCHEPETLKGFMLPAPLAASGDGARSPRSDGESR